MMNKNKIVKAMPTVLFAVGIVGVFVSEVMCARDTLKAKDILEKYPVEIVDHEKPRQYASNAVYITLCLNKKTYVREVVKSTWKSYIPTAISTTLTLTCLIASKKLDKKQIAALSALAASSAGLVTRYREVIEDVLDADVLSDIDKEVGKREIEHANVKQINNPTSAVTAYEEMDLNLDEEVIFFDPFTKMKFKASKLAFLGAKYYLNRNFAIGGSVPLRMFYDFLGLELSEEYNYAGWDIDNMNESGYCWIDIDVVKSDSKDPETGELYYIIEYTFEPGDTDDSYSFYPSGNPLTYEGSYQV